MGKVVVVPESDWISYTISSYSSQQSLYPASNITQPWRRNASWRTSGTGNAWVVLDFSTAKAVTCVALIFTNFTTFKIQGNSTNSWTTPAYDSGNLSISSEHWTDIYRKYVDLSQSGFNYRYMRIFIPTQTPVDGAGHFELGGVIVSDSTSKELPVNPFWGLETTHGLVLMEKALLSGRVERISIRDDGKVLSLNLPFRLDPRVTDAEKNLFKKLNHSKRLMLYLNQNFPQFVDDTPCVFVMELGNRVSVSYASFGVSEYQFELREAV